METVDRPDQLAGISAQAIQLPNQQRAARPTSLEGITQTGSALNLRSSTFNVGKYEVWLNPCRFHSVDLQVIGLLLRAHAHVTDEAQRIRQSSQSPFV
jgi:hypothetical protein